MFVITNFKKILQHIATGGLFSSSCGARWKAVAAGILFTVGVVGLGTHFAAQGAPESKVSSTKHNLSITGPGSVKATSETQICIFCHTPHNANASVKAPLWNRQVNTAAGTYTRYTSLSLDANNIANGFSDQPGGSSLLCLSCHDGTVALGDVSVLPKTTGTSGSTINLNGTNAGKMPVGKGVNTGYTPNLGSNLTNDHPISITYNNTLAETDTELARMDTQQKDTGFNGALIGIRGSGYKPKLPLEPTGPNGEGQVQCASCHDPHLFDSEDPNRKFLRLNRLAKDEPSASAEFVPATDIICMGCHRKLYSAWGRSAHAKKSTANETYTDAAADLRGFPRGTTVWQASCLNCHDMHTVQGSRRLLREGAGTDLTTGGSGSGVYQLGMAPLGAAEDYGKYAAIETTCFKCHRNAGEANGNILVASGVLNDIVPSTKSLFDMKYGMPVATGDQPTTTGEVHNVRNGDMEEDPVNLGQGGFGNNAKRHVECTDCHNPHRVRRSRTFAEEEGVATEIRTHRPGGALGNIASGVLRGTWGVEPSFGWSATSWPTAPTSFNIKKGDPHTVPVPTTKAESDAASYLTREYQLCFKCHSNYTNSTSPASFPSIVADYAPTVNTRRTSVSDANGLTRYTNVAAEFGSVKATNPATTGTDQGEFSGGSSKTNNVGQACGGGDCQPRTMSSPGGANAAYTNNAYNHRSWHPVVFPTGRDRGERGMQGTGNTGINLLPPFRATIGANTMHCSDCHGQAASWKPGLEDGTGGAIDSEVQGPHGSTNPFLLRGTWNLNITLSNYDSSRSSTTLNRALCTNCHDPRGRMTTSTNSGVRTGFSGPDLSADHTGDGDMLNLSCMRCHIALPHGWKNKAFLVNLNCVGSEVGRSASLWSAAIKSAPSECDDAGSYTKTLNEEPYYYGSRLFIQTWMRSGTWTRAACDSGMTGCTTN